MMAETIDETEAVPLDYPDTPSGLSTAAAALDANAIWQRIEAYTAHRYTDREVTWLVEGKGHWGFPLTPATLSSAERWTGEAWEAVTLSAGPYGYCLPDEGPYRIIADVGAGTVPAAVSEAFRRLAEYLADDTDRAGVSDYMVNMGGAIQESYKRNPAWTARAMQYSGAADLLRPYRRA
ncbi:MAG: hypothetical protein QNI87_12095 [Erythrobacter sp.]|uniref:hypothetical protein n=1 Tax=Erythrobacter sp. TaxID=1042 RepID=UPI00260A6E3F|nr:hypothetical protein [Erythrobacter sp.]MDJ0979258.1 hypothetical protein [Erythrobacter sp.]